MQNDGGISVNERIISLDVARGFALAGILFAHAVIWFSGSALPDAVYNKFTDTASLTAMAIFGFFVLGKFFTVFSFLFGYAFFQQQKRGAEGRVTYLKRLLVLGLFGLVHHIFWNGDILMIYAMLGLLLGPMNRLSDRTLSILAVVLIINLPGLLIACISGGYSGHPLEAQADNTYRMMVQGSWNDIIAFNLDVLNDKIKYQLLRGRIFMTLGFFLLGLLAARKRFFHRHDLLAKCRLALKIALRVCTVMLLLGICFYAFDIVSLPDIQYSASWQPVLQSCFDIFNASMTILYLAGINVMMADRFWQRSISFLRYPGKMPLTTYLIQTAIGIGLFYHVGFGLFAYTTPWQNALMVLPIFTAQVWFSKWWLTRYQTGPLEWAWRSIAESRWLPLRRKVLS